MIWSGVKRFEINNSVISSNQSDLDGGGIVIEGIDTAIVINNTITKNSIPAGRYGTAIAINSGVLTKNTWYITMYSHVRKF